MPAYHNPYGYALSRLLGTNPNWQAYGLPLGFFELRDGG